MKNININTLITIQNAQLLKRKFIFCAKSKTSENMLDFLWQEGLIVNFKIVNTNTFKIFLKYIKNKPVINTIKIISTPGKKINLTNSQMLKINRQDFLIMILTDAGLKSLEQCQKAKIGGQIMALIN